MSIAPTGGPTRPRPLRLWPGVVIVGVQWLGRYVVPLVAPEATMYGVLGALACGLLLVLWWLFFSRAPWVERIGAVALMAAALAVTPRILHESIATGAMGMLYPILAVPILSLAFVVWAAASRRLSTGLRRATMVATILLACGGWALVRTGGFTGYGDSDFAWRWSATLEERLLAQAGDEPLAPPPAPMTTEASAEAPSGPPSAPAGDVQTVAPPAAAEVPEDPPTAQAAEEPAVLPPAAPAAATRADWPGFRGAERDGVVRGARIATDWTTSPPVELWRRAIGPGWSSFAVHGDRLYTQEQRGDDEVVACYHATTGEPVWRHHDAVRFWESNAGAGPRGTPTLSNGRVYTLGATGIVNALDAGNGAVLWSRDAAADTGAKLPIWGFSGSPLVVGDDVVVAASGALVAYDANTGEPRWFGPAGGEGYSSPHLATIDGTAQIVQLSGAGVTGVAPADGTLLWEHPWKGYPIVQPALTTDGDVLISVNADSGLRRIAIAHGPGGWSVEERWTSKGLKPYFNDFVIHQGHAYGFDGGILASISLKDGQRRWKGGRYGHGQLVLLPDQDVLLVLSEKGELALVGATPERFTELARLPAIEGKTWNHPVLVGDLLLVRNGQEMVAFRLPSTGG
jgi:outer membrane protein assembly factor BamB